MTVARVFTFKRLYLRPTMALAAVAIFAGPGIAAAQSESQAMDGSWIVLSEPRVDLWYHGLAVIGFGEVPQVSMYDSAYVERVKAAKQELGIYPTPLDESAERLRRDLDRAPASELLHFVPLYFPEASRERMLRALLAVAERRTRDSTIAGGDTRAGMRLLEARFREGGQRDRLRQLVHLLEQEWDLFYRDFRQQTAAGDETYVAEMSRRWTEEVEPAISEFLAAEDLDSGRIYIAPALGLEGRMFEGSTFQRTVHALTVWAPAWNDPRASLFSVVREMCYSVSGDALRSSARGLTQPMVTRAAVQCGARLLQHTSPELASEYRSVYLRAAGFSEAGMNVDSIFGEVYGLDSEIRDSLDVRLRIAPGMESDAPPPLTDWTFEAKPQVDLWFHVLAVAAADEPGPLGMYSAEYARHIREAKQELGIYPTKLDSIAPELRQSIFRLDDLPRTDLHFIPLYFPHADPERMLNALREFARGRLERAAGGGPTVLKGLQIVNQRFVGGREQRALREIADAAEREWDDFYRDYWERQLEQLQPRYRAVEAVWDSLLAPQLGPYLVRRRLNAGLVIPSPPLGPEGRIVDYDEYVPNDQTVSVQVPLDSEGPNGTVFAFLKELCFLFIDNDDLTEFAEGPDELEDIRRTAAVRCGGLVLQFYAPTLSAPYRRAFLDAVGATEGYTVAAFQRVYALEPEVFDLVRQQIRRR